MAEKNEIKIEPADIEAYAKKVAKAEFARYGMVGLEDAMYENYARDMMKKPETIRSFADRAIEEKVLGLLKNSVKLENTDISMEDFNKMFEIEQN